MPALPRSAIVLAGGLGTRLRSAVPDLPKPMAPVGGEPFLARLLDHWIARGIDHFVLSVGYRHEAIVDHFGSAWHGARVDYAVETSPRGTGGGLLLAAEALPRDRRFVLLNGDTWFDVDLARLAGFTEACDADWCFALFRPLEQGRYMGLVLAADGRIEAFRGAPGGPANGGVYLVHPRALPRADPDRSASLENDLFPAFAAQGQRLFGLECPGDFIDIGVPDDWRRAASVLPPSRRSEPAHA
jgi:D-glycero-alpha-D-manno-heptose 1-phosphate guanylyltransferase